MRPRARRVNRNHSNTDQKKAHITNQSARMRATLQKRDRLIIADKSARMRTLCVCVYI